MRISMETREKIRRTLTNKDPENLQELFTEDHKQVLLGSVIGDASLRPSTINSSFEETHGVNQRKYLLWKNEYLNIFNGKVKNKLNKNKKLNKIYPAVRLSTSSLPTITKYRKMFYPDGKKIINLDILNQLNELGLAVWYLDDGHVCLLENLVVISTDCFTYEEHKIMRRWFNGRFGVIPRISKRKGKYYLTFDREDSDKLFEIFKKVFGKYNIPDNMYYKLGHSWSGNSERIEIARKKKYASRQKWRDKRREIKQAKKREIYQKLTDRIRYFYWNKGLTPIQIGKKLGYAKAGIYKLMKTYNIPRRSRSEANSGKRNGFYGKKQSKESIQKMLKTRWGK